MSNTIMYNKHFLVLDANVWVYDTHLLSDSTGSAILYSLRRMRRNIVIPEIVKREIIKLTEKRGKEAVDNISFYFNIIEKLLGHRDEYILPPLGSFRNRVDSRINELGDLVYQTDFKLDHAKGALDRVMEGIAPSSKKRQQFKDSAIWENILELAEHGNVDFVTKDKDFFQNDPENNPVKLASDLVKDIECVQNSIRIFYKIEPYLNNIIDERPSFDSRKITDKIDDTIKPDLINKAQENDYDLGELYDSSINAYLTEKVDTIDIHFKIVYKVSNITNQNTGNIIDGYQIVKGKCSYNLKEENIEYFQIDEKDFVDISGEVIPAYGVRIIRTGDNIIGRKTVPYTFKTPLS